MPITQPSEVDLQNLVEMFSGEIDFQLTNRSNQEQNWEKWIQGYKAEPKTARKIVPWEGASNLVIGLIPIFVDSIVARIMQGVFSVDPHWVGTQLSEKYAPTVKPLERYLDWCRTNTWDQYKVVKPMVLEMIKLGTGILYNGWRDTRNISFGLDGAKTETKISSPCPEWISRWDFLMCPGYTDLQLAPWIARRPWYSWQDLQTLAYTGFFQNIDNLKGNGDTDNKVITFQRGTSKPTQVTDEHMFGLWGPWQVWFRQDLDNDGYPEQYIMTLHVKSKTCLRFSPNPYINGLRTFVRSPFVEVEGEFDGQGVPEMIYQYQEEASTQHNQRIDGMTLANSPVLAARKGSGITERERFKVGKIWLVTDPIQDLREFKFSNNSQNSIQNEQMTIALAEKRVGISDVNLGRENPSIGRSTATTVMALLQEGTRRFDLNTSELRNALTEQGLQILELFQTHGLPNPGQPASPEQVLDDKDAALVRALLESQDGVRGLVGLKLNVATAAVNKEMEKQANQQLLGIVSSYFEQFKNNLMQLGPVLMNPQSPPAIKALAIHMIEGIDLMMTKLFQSYSAFDLDQILMGDILAQMLQSQPAGAIGGSPPNGLQTNVENPSAPTQPPTDSGNGPYSYQ